MIKQRRLGTFYLDWVGETNKPAFLLLESQRSNYFEVPKEVNFKELCYDVNLKYNKSQIYKIEILDT